MKEFGCKILAAVFIIAIIFSLLEMRKDVLRPHYFQFEGQHIELSSPIQLYDHVLIGPELKIGYVRGITNGVYYVILRNESHQRVEKQYGREQLRKIIPISQ